MKGNFEFNQSHKIYTLLVGGIPGIGKTFFSNQVKTYITNEHSNNNSFNIKVLNFDQIENINADNYFNFQEMRDDYVKEYSNYLMGINDSNNKLYEYIILDDNFFLKSMRKKIYQNLINHIESKQNTKYTYYYIEIFLKCTNLSIAFSNNESRKEIIPINVIQNIHDKFEYSSPYLSDCKNVFIYNIDDINSLKKFPFKTVFNYIIENKCKISLNSNKIQPLIISKTYEAKIIDLIELQLRKEINLYLTKNSQMRSKGKDLSNYKKEYIKLLNHALTSTKQPVNNENKYLYDLLQQFHLSKNQDNIDIFVNYFISKYCN
jgi:hypothetical protein